MGKNKLPPQAVHPEEAKPNAFGSHYHGTAVDDFIEEFKLGFRLGNVVKYVARNAEKGNPLEDLKKALWYLRREISRLEETPK